MNVNLSHYDSAGKLKGGSGEHKTFSFHHFRPDGSLMTDALRNVAGEFAGEFAEKASPVSGDTLLIEDSEADGVKKYVQVGNLPGSGSGTDEGATFLAWRGY